MKRILISLSIIGIVAAIGIGGTIAYYHDTETSTGNTFTAGSIDLKVDLQCENGVCGFPLKDLTGDHFFSECDIKPGDSGEVTISFHVYDNNAWGRIGLADVHDWEYGCTEPEEEYPDPTCDSPGDGLGELSQYLTFTIWLDEGSVEGWQCPENKPCEVDSEEGNNVLDEGETILAEDIPASQLIDGWYVLPQEIIGSNTYYVGVKWELPFTAGNIVQSDSLQASIVMQVVQSKSNPDKVF